MNTIESGERFIGYGDSVTCPRCNNNVQQHVLMRFFSVGLLYIPIFGTDRYSPEIRCPICREFFGRKAWLDALEKGKVYTKAHLKTLNPVARMIILRDLKALKATAIIDYLKS